MLYCATDTQFSQNLFTQNYRPILVRDVMEPEGETTGIVTERKEETREANRI